MKTIWRFTTVRLVCLYGAASLLGVDVIHLWMTMNKEEADTQIFISVGLLCLLMLFISVNHLLLAKRLKETKTAWNFRTPQVIGLYGAAFVLGAEMMLVRMNLNAGRGITYIVLSNGLLSLAMVGMSLNTILQAKNYRGTLEADSV